VLQHARRVIATVSRDSRAASGPAHRVNQPLIQAPTSVVPLRGVRGTIAQRMHDSLHDMAQLTLHMDVDMTWVVADREARRPTPDLPSYTDYVIAASAVALRRHPTVNSQITDDGVALLPRIDIGIAVALDDGLLVPVVRDAPRHDLGSLAVETSRLASAARSRSLQYDDLSGSTFTVTSLGMFGVDGFTPIVNAPNTAILGVGRVRTDTRWVDGRPTPVPVLTLSLTWDHRAFDGAPAAAFTRTVAETLESGVLV
jgi:pyruvate dehydrogenase E2 component (dihydrolipoamide acetyltransferase)